jgi:hypothetical protein
MNYTQSSQKEYFGGVNKAPADPAAWEGMGQEGTQTYIILKCVMGSFRLDSILLPEGSTGRDLKVT